MSLRGLVRSGDVIFAYGLHIAKFGDAGALLTVARESNGAWTATRVAALPNTASARALECERTREGKEEDDE
jgi:hypothetical protein